MAILITKLRHSLNMVIPIVLIVVFINFFVISISNQILINFLIGAVFVSFGLGVFLLGVEKGVSTFGELAGEKIVRSNKLWVVIVGGLILGIVITVAEPALIILVGQVEFITNESVSGLILLFVVAIGLAISFSLGLVRIFYGFSLRKTLFVSYFIIIIIAFFAFDEFRAIAFDSAGATTGVFAVPFILSLAHGVSALKKNQQEASNDSFGLVALASVGPIIAVLIFSFFVNIESFAVLNNSNNAVSNDFFNLLNYHFIPVLIDVILVLLPLTITFVLLQIFIFKLKRKRLIKMLKGFLFAFIGLFIFLIGVNVGFMNLGELIGDNMFSNNKVGTLLLFSFLIGAGIVAAEPAVHVLTKQIEDVTSGYIKKNTVLFSLIFGVGIAVLLAVLRIINPSLELWHLLLPGYIIAILFTLFIPKLFVGISFDSGGVATGPMTATFVLAFTQGVANNMDNSSMLINGFGMIALVALVPILTLEILGFIYKVKTRKVGRDNE